MTIDDWTLHPGFTLNGISYTESSLKELGYNLVKEGNTFEKSIGDFVSDWLDDKPSLEVKTSGSTGTPKNILLEKRQMVNSAMATGTFFNLQEGNSALLCLPTDYIAGKMMLVRAMILGLELDYVEPSSNPLGELTKTYDFVAMVPLQLENSLSEIESIKTLIIGGTPLSRTLKKKVQGRSTKVYETYGMTETITHIAIRKVNKVTERSRSRFIALPNVAFSKDKRDCLVISAPKVSDELVITNDIVNLISETEFEWLGRQNLNGWGVMTMLSTLEV